jgi:iron complex outermembrane receptor protein
VADKVVGKAAAALMIIGEIKELHTHVLSTPALSLLKNTNIKVSFDKPADQIRNRTNTGFCPMESLCLECNTAEECFEKLKKKFAFKVD